MLFSLRKHYLDNYITDTALKVSQSLYHFTTFISHGVENYFPRLWGMGISNAIFYLALLFQLLPVISTTRVPSPMEWVPLGTPAPTTTQPILTVLLT